MGSQAKRLIKIPSILGSITSIDLGLKRTIKQVFRVQRKTKNTLNWKEEKHLLEFNFKYR